MQKFALPTVLNVIKRNIAELAIRFGTNKFEIEEIGTEPISGKKISGVNRWPITEALDYFEAQGVLKRQESCLEILDGNYFNINLKSLSIPIDFTIDKRIEKNLAVMTGLYGQLFDIENRIRFFLTEKLKQKYGDVFLNKLRKKVQDSIQSEKSKLRIFITDVRISELEFSNFSDLIDIFRDEIDFISAKRSNQVLIEKMEYLNEVRTAIGHHNLLVSDEIGRIRESCLTIRKILEQNMSMPLNNT